MYTRPSLNVNAVEILLRINVQKLNVIPRDTYSKSKYVPSFALIANLGINIANLIFPMNLEMPKYCHTKFSKSVTKNEFNREWNVYMTKTGCNIFYCGHCIFAALILQTSTVIEANTFNAILKLYEKLVKLWKCHNKSQQVASYDRPRDEMVASFSIIQYKGELLHWEKTLFRSKKICISFTT